MNAEVLLDPISVVKVTLSRRNLKALLLKLDEPTSRRTLTRRVGDDLVLTVTAEDDDVHYGDREPGPVHPREEAKLAEEAA